MAGVVMPMPEQVAAAVQRRTEDVVGRLAACDDAALLAPSTLPGWSRCTIACHLRYGAEALARMTDDALAGRPAAYYPGGRTVQRPGTLEPRPGESPADVVTAFASASAALGERWGRLTGAEWDVVAVEPEDNPDLGPSPLRTLALLRLTEVEVHGTDLDLGLPDWSPTFVTAALPMRVARLATRMALRPADGAWLLVSADGPTHLVTVAGGAVTSVQAAPDAGPDAPRIEGASRDLVALLLGRPPLEPLRADPGVVDAFTRAFPGP